MEVTPADAATALRHSNLSVVGTELPGWDLRYQHDGVKGWVKDDTLLLTTPTHVPSVQHRQRINASLRTLHDTFDSFEYAPCFPKDHPHAQKIQYPGLLLVPLPPSRHAFSLDTDDVSTALVGGTVAQAVSHAGKLYSQARVRLGGGATADATIQKLIDTPLSDADMRTLLGEDLAIMTYPQLDNVEHIWNAMDSKGRLVVLFLTVSKTSGHWTCVFKRDAKTIEYFDPYGLPWDAGFRWLSDSEEQALDQTEHAMTRLLTDARRSGYKVYNSPIEFQKYSSKVDTCGRWVCARLLYKSLSPEQFAELVNKSGEDSDVFVTLLTDQILTQRGASSAGSATATIAPAILSSNEVSTPFT